MRKNVQAERTPLTPNEREKHSALGGPDPALASPPLSHVSGQDWGEFPGESDKAFFR